MFQTANSEYVKDVQYTIVNSTQSISYVLTALSISSQLALDTETTGLRPFHDSKLRLLTIRTDTGETFVIDCFKVDPREILESIKGKVVIAHNWAFDGPFLALNGFDYAANALRDTMIASFLVTCGYKTSNSLSSALSLQLGIDIDKEHQKSDWSGNLTKEQLDYAAKDVEHLIPLYETLVGKLKEEKLWRIWKLEMKVLKAVIWMRMNGVQVDRDRWITLYNQAIHRRTRLAQELKDMVPARTFSSPWSWRKPTDIKQAAGRLGIPLASTNKASMALLGEYPFIAKIQEWRKCDQIIKTFGPDWLDFRGRDGQVHAEFVQCRPETGRFSCNNPNMQQIPRGPHRKCFTAKAGWSIVACDYSMLEIRMMANIAKEKAMIEAFKNKEDLHLRTAKFVMGVDNPTKEDRTLAKAIGFGLLFGCSAKTLRTTTAANWNIVLPLEKVKELRAKFFEIYPDLAKFHNRMKKYKKGRWRTPWGRIRYNLIAEPFKNSKGVWEMKEPFTKLVNTPIQAAAADGAKQALADLWSNRKKFPQMKLLGIVHDEIIVTCPDYEAKEVGKFLQQTMISAMQPLLGPVQCEAEVGIGKTWGDAK